MKPTSNAQSAFVQTPLLSTASTQPLSPPSQRFRGFARATGDSLRTAINLGTATANRPLRVNRRDALGRGDRADWYRIQVAPSINVPGFTRYSATGNGVRLQGFYDAGNGSPLTTTIPPAFTFRSRAPIVSNAPYFNNLSTTATFYFKLVPIRGRTSYQILIRTNP